MTKYTHLNIFMLAHKDSFTVLAIEIKSLLYFLKQHHKNSNSFLLKSQQ